MDEAARVEQLKAELEAATPDETKEIATELISIATSVNQLTNHGHDLAHALVAWCEYSSGNGASVQGTVKRSLWWEVADHVYAITGVRLTMP